ncbi:uncharacterized protein RBU33_028422 isoform 1-T1 [Hipposideros larvatus]
MNFVYFFEAWRTREKGRRLPLYHMKPPCPCSGTRAAPRDGLVSDSAACPPFCSTDGKSKSSVEPFTEQKVMDLRRNMKHKREHVTCLPCFWSWKFGLIIFSQANALMVQLWQKTDTK